MRTTVLIILLAGLSTAGCANTSELRTLSSESASLLNDYRSMLKSAAARHTAVNAGNERRLRDLDALRAQAQGKTRYRALALEMAKDNDAAEVQRLATTKRAQDVVAESQALSSLTPSPTAATMTIDVAQIEALVKRLKELAVEPTAWDRLAEGLRHAGAFQAALNATQEETEGVARAAEAAARKLDAAPSAPKV